MNLQIKYKHNSRMNYRNVNIICCYANIRGVFSTGPISESRPRRGCGAEGEEEGLGASRGTCIPDVSLSSQEIESTA